MSVYKIVEIIGTSPKSWEDAVRKAIATAGKSLEKLRVAQVMEQDVTVDKGKVVMFAIRRSGGRKTPPLSNNDGRVRK